MSDKTATSALPFSKKMLIANEWQAASNGETLVVINPATAQTIGEIAAADASDVNRAVVSAKQAFEGGSWRTMRPIDRSKLLEGIANLIELHGQELAELESLDNGKPVHLALMVDIPSAVDVFRYMAGWCTKLGGKTLPVSGDGSAYHAYTLRQPVGVVAAIVPWNYPLTMAAWKIAPALAAGCTVVLKPSEETSLTALRLGELIVEAGLPSGVLNIVTGTGAVAGEALITHPDVDKIAFTGSTAVGKHILASSALDLRHVSLELGGKSPTIIMPDANLERAIPDAAMAIFFNSGQTCFAGSRLLCHEDIYDQVIEGIAQVAQSLPVGDGSRPDTMIGPVINTKQRDRILEYIEIGQQQGARLITGGKTSAKQGYFVEPTILTDVTAESRVFNEEIFGPVLAVTKFSNEEEAINLANKSVYGLGANIYSANVNTCHRMAAKINAGTVWLNTYFVVEPAMSFGGFKQSGLGREMGEDGILMYTESKSVCLRLDD